MQTGEEPWLGTLYCLNPAVCRGGEVGCEAGESEGIEAIGYWFGACSCCKQFCGRATGTAGHWLVLALAQQQRHVTMHRPVP